MTYWPSLRNYNEASQSMATGRMMQAWMNNPRLSVRGLASKAQVSTATSRRFIQALRCPTTTVICQVRPGFSCSYKGRIYQAWERLELSLRGYQARTVQLSVIKLLGKA